MALQPEKTARDISRRRQYFYRKMTSFLISGVISRETSGGVTKCRLFKWARVREKFLYTGAPNENIVQTT